MSDRSEIFKVALDMQNRLESIMKVIETAERWCEDQSNDLTHQQICMAALKDIRRIVRKKYDE